ncbi:sensor with HAMP domain [Streptomyces sp. KO7888]|nr:sensor with HAMP domain [Streptomyces sp. KO7888]
MPHSIEDRTPPVPAGRAATVPYPLLLRCGHPPVGRVHGLDLLAGPREPANVPGLSSSWSSSPPCSSPRPSPCGASPFPQQAGPGTTLPRTCCRAPAVTLPPEGPSRFPRVSPSPDSARRVRSPRSADSPLRSTPPLPLQALGPKARLRTRAASPS